VVDFPPLIVEWPKPVIHDFPVLITQPMMPLILDGITQRFPTERLDLVADRDAFLAAQGPRFRALVCGQAGPIRAELLSRLPNLRIISSFGVGYDAVETTFARSHGIVVTNTPDVLTDEVADLAMGLLIATVRRLPQADQFVRTGQWLKGNFPLSDTLRGKSMGILGLGRIGKAIADRAAAFGISMAYHGRQKQDGVSYPFFASLEEMARAVDILMIIAPGGAATKGIVTKAVIEALGPQGTLINVARGSLVDEPALVAALQSGQLGAAGLDVFEDEPRVPGALFGLENVVLLPHVGSASVHTRNRMGQLVVDNVIAIAEGRPPLTPVPETPWPA
jgi:lactate dehydrogenase-like 2-hydroxyacid dehydrogenase